VKRTNASRAADGLFAPSDGPKARRVEVWLQPGTIALIDAICAQEGIGRGKAIDRLLMPPPPTSDPAANAMAGRSKKAKSRDEKWLLQRWLPIAQHLKAAHDLIKAEKERLCREYAGKEGSLMMQARWQRMGESWSDSGLLDQFAAATGEPTARTLSGLLAELERASRMASGWLAAMEMFTGCKPDPNRYQLPTPTDPR
jgi:hypothetical protein